jgi:hypothetical protein
MSKKGTPLKKSTKMGAVKTLKSTSLGGVRPLKTPHII